jgi:hypothetical protein
MIPIQAEECKMAQSPLTPTTPSFPPIFSPNRFRLRTQSVARSDVKFDSMAGTLSDAKSNTVGKVLQVAKYIRSSKDSKQLRGAFRTMYVSITADSENPFCKQLLLADTTGHNETVPLVGTSAALTSMFELHPDDAQPSFAENSIIIFAPLSMVSLIVANPSSEDQRNFLDCLCAAGCIVRDLQHHFAFLPQPDQIIEGVRLISPTTPRTRTNANIMALKVATDTDRMKQLCDEVNFLLNLRHDGIVGAYGIYEVKVEGKRSLAMVLDYKSGEDLSHWIPPDGFPERIVRGIMVQICDAMAYLHEILVVHRDMKPSNVLCECSEDGSVKVVLADFGLAAHITDKKNMSRRCGTVGYIAPEVFGRDWPMAWAETTAACLTKVDVFSFGMMIYTTTFGSNPFLGPSGQSSYERNALARVSLANMGGRSDELQSLLSSLCAKNPRRRISSAGALLHPWFSRNDGSSRAEDERETSTVRWTAFVRSAHFSMS